MQSAVMGALRRSQCGSCRRRSWVHVLLPILAYYLPSYAEYALRGLARSHQAVACQVLEEWWIRAGFAT